TKRNPVRPGRPIGISVENAMASGQEKSVCAVVSDFGAAADERVVDEKCAGRRLCVLFKIGGDSKNQEPEHYD
ncbi:hypothetical protein, partial [Streptococcus pneumoniae]|uniref:hypothetical protein n=1 Tax=Streptococcus pneumoniae TaxID=1313 RepID=UPI001E436BBF